MTKISLDLHHDTAATLDAEVADQRETVKSQQQARDVTRAYLRDQQCKRIWENHNKVNGKPPASLFEANQLFVDLPDLYIIWEVKREEETAQTLDGLGELALREHAEVSHPALAKAIVRSWLALVLCVPEGTASSAEPWVLQYIANCASAYEAGLAARAAYGGGGGGEAYVRASPRVSAAPLMRTSGRRPANQNHRTAWTQS
jgi:hypothetical protein